MKLIRELLKEYKLHSSSNVVREEGEYTVSLDWNGDFDESEVEESIHSALGFNMGDLHDDPSVQADLNTKVGKHRPNVTWTIEKFQHEWFVNVQGSYDDVVAFIKGWFIDDEDSIDDAIETIEKL